MAGAKADARKDWTPRLCAIELTNADINTPSACHQVFSIFELAEAIFLELTMRDVLVDVQRTSRGWHDVVDRSLPLQQALFFKPISTSLLHLFRSEDRDGVVRPRWAETQHSNKSFIIEHPILTGAWVETESSRWHKTDPAGPYNRPEASWKRQLLTQPPVAEVEIVCHSPSRTTLSSTSGVRMGDLNLQVCLKTLPFMGSERWKTSWMDRETLAAMRDRMLESGA